MLYKQEKSDGKEIASFISPADNYECRKNLYSTRLYSLLGNAIGYRTNTTLYNAQKSSLFSCIRTINTETMHITISTFNSLVSKEPKMHLMALIA